MTIQYLPIHKYSATPRLAHLPAAPTPRPTMTMAEMAALENKAAGFGQVATSRKKGGKADKLGRRIFEYVRDHPCATTAQVVEHLNVKARSVYNAVQAARAIAQEEGYDWHVKDVRSKKGAVAKRLYWLEAQA